METDSCTTGKFPNRSANGSVFEVPSFRQVFRDRQNAHLTIKLHFVGGIGSNLYLAGLSSKPRDDVANWATLELGDHFAQFSDPVREILQPMMVNVVVGLGDTAELSDASHTAAVVASQPANTKTA